MALSAIAAGAITAGIAAAGSAASAGITAGSSAASQRRSLKYNEQLYDYQTEVNRQNWAMENAYNTPAAQMARFKEAGLNPHLIYGQGESGNAGSVNSASMAPAPYVNPLENLNIAQMVQQTQQMYFDTKLKQLAVNREQAAYQADMREQEEKQLAFAALQTFIHDRWLKDHPGETDDWFEKRIGSVTADRARKSPYYESFNQLLQQGQIKGAELNKILGSIALMSAQRGVLGEQKQLLAHNNEIQQNMDKLLNLDFQDMEFGDITRAILQIIMTLVRGNTPINL